MRHIDIESTIRVELYQCLLEVNVGRDYGNEWYWLHIYCHIQGCLYQEVGLVRRKGVILYGIGVKWWYFLYSKEYISCN